MALVKVLNSGYTDITTTDIWKFSFHSQYPTMKIALQGTFNLTLTSNGDGSYNEAIRTITHSLGYRPLCFFYAVIGSQSIPFHGETAFTNSGILDYYGSEADPIFTSVIGTSAIDFRFISVFDVQSTSVATINYIIMLDEF